jgi:hypothetical protein
MTPLTDPASVSREDLLALAASLPSQVAELIASDEALRAEIEELKYSDRPQSVAVLEKRPRQAPL